MQMHKRIYENERMRIAVYYAAGDSEDLASFSECIDLHFSGSLPAVFRRRGTKLFCRYKIADTNTTIERIECFGDVKFSDLRTHVPSVFDLSHIKKANGRAFCEKNRKLIVRLAGKVLGTDEVLQLAPGISEN